MASVPSIDMDVYFIAVRDGVRDEPRPIDGFALPLERGHVYQVGDERLRYLRVIGDWYYFQPANEPYDLAA